MQRQVHTSEITENQGVLTSSFRWPRMFGERPARRRKLHEGRAQPTLGGRPACGSQGALSERYGAMKRGLSLATAAMKKALTRWHSGPAKKAHTVSNWTRRCDAMAAGLFDVASYLARTVAATAVAPSARGRVSVVGTTATTMGRTATAMGRKGDGRAADEGKEGERGENDFHLGLFLSGASPTRGSSGRWSGSRSKG
jgi:hypothetical protein